jgi:iron complex outermembrane receptor protein
VALGVNNLFDEYPNATPINVNTNGPIGFPSYSPFGFNGRFLYGPPRATAGRTRP